jgi:phosphoribosyl 1,2-cyclic phosphate phosphodiesterase
MLCGKSNTRPISILDALDFIALVQPEKAYPTHVSHMLGFHEEVQKSLPENVYLAYDDNLEINYN